MCQIPVRITITNRIIPHCIIWRVSIHQLSLRVHLHPSRSRRIKTSIVGHINPYIQILETFDIVVFVSIVKATLLDIVTLELLSPGAL